MSVLGFPGGPLVGLRLAGSNHLLSSACNKPRPPFISRNTHRLWLRSVVSSHIAVRILHFCCQCLGVFLSGIAKELFLVGKLNFERLQFERKIQYCVNHTIWCWWKDSDDPSFSFLLQQVHTGGGPTGSTGCCLDIITTRLWLAQLGVTWPWFAT